MVRLKNWIAAFLVCALIVGCGGGGSGTGGTSGGTGGTGGTSGGRGIPTVNLGTASQVQVLYLSGQGRRAPGSQIAELGPIQVQNGPADFAPTEQQGSGSAVRIQLDGYTLNQFVFSVTVSPDQPFKEYTEFPLSIAKIDEDTGSGFTTVYSGPTFTESPPFSADVRVFPGRQTTLQVNLNDAMLRFDPSDGLVFDRFQFESENYAPFNDKVNGFLSDLVAFDITGLSNASRPLMENGSRAEQIFFSGDLIALSAGFETEGSFELLDPIVIVETGIIKPPTNLGGTPAPGTYLAKELDPRNSDPNVDVRISALQGFYRPYTEVLGNLSDFGAVAFPNSRSELGIGDLFDVVFFNRNAAGQITALWQGIVSFDTDTQGVIELWPISNIKDGVADPLGSGTITYTKVNGVVKQGTFSITTSTEAFPFPRSGGFVVFRN